MVLPVDKIYWESFRTFFKIGMVTFGGGYAMIPIITTEVVDKHHWVSEEELLDLIAISQSCPGVFAINISTFIGYKLKGNKGALCTSLATALPSFFIILLIALFFHQFEDNRVIAALFRGIRPAVVALIAVPTFNLARKAKINLSNCWIPILGAMAIWAFGVSPIIVIILAGIGGYVYGKYIKPTE
ncbi:MAG: chromate transporter [Prevotella sp.]|nr:chromate transporter [Prevotella sp.]